MFASKNKAAWVRAVMLSFTLQCLMAPPSLSEQDDNSSSPNDSIDAAVQQMIQQQQDQQQQQQQQQQQAMQQMQQQQQQAMQQAQQAQQQAMQNQDQASNDNSAAMAAAAGAAMSGLMCMLMMREAMKKDDPMLKMMAMQECSQAAQQAAAAKQNDNNKNQLQQPNTTTGSQMPAMASNSSSKPGDTSLPTGSGGSSGSSLSPQDSLKDITLPTDISQPNVTVPDTNNPNSLNVAGPAAPLASKSSVPNVIPDTNLSYDEASKGGGATPNPYSNGMGMMGMGMAPGQPLTADQLKKLTESKGNSASDSVASGGRARAGSADGGESSGSGNSGGGSSGNGQGNGTGGGPLDLAALFGGGSQAAADASANGGTDIIQLDKGEKNKPGPNIFDYASYRYRNLAFNEGRILTNVKGSRRTQMISRAGAALASVAPSEAAVTP